MSRSLSGRWPTISDFLAQWLEEPRLAEKEQATFARYYHSYRGNFDPYIRRHYADQSREVTALLAQAEDGQPLRLLEIGAGCGTEALWFALSGASVLSIDISPDRLAAARARLAVVEREASRKLDLSFEEASFFELELKDEVDIVWMEQTFHRLEPREAVYRTVARALKPGGHVILSEANGWNPLLQAALFRQRGWRTRVRRTRPDGSILEYGNERITVPAALKRGFRRAGIEPVSSRYFRMLPNASWTPRFGGLERAMPGFLKPLFCTHYNFVGRKSDG